MFDFVLVPAYDLIRSLSDLTGAALAIVLFTLGVRLLLLPLGIRIARGQRIRMRLAPDVEKLRKRFRQDPVRLSQEVNALYAKEGTSMASGFLLPLAQSPFFMVAYRLFTSAVIAGHPNLLLARGVLGVPLGEHFGAVLAGAGLFSAPGLVFLGLFALLVLAAWVASRRVDEGVPMRRLLMLLPFGTVLAAAVLPLAAGLYLLVTTAWTTTERIVLYPRPA
ncbi:YidC/Oxa1 family membrane protein insertase [Planotetraspora sp. A-T 1434]|uniref:YidC/Oxa1 family membrane protein insertase n=1 Tax=Planotetraspora sp. A-T 1434 TaxID=2979219 RepID=UPI0021BF7A1F|nr:YidC/Oxa1 family membrane protein insertase [Planotetraspora sp. A-T 1434]MCT9931747.1 YidC/Oxa1 family membrane protein insertase [Planotetraspora sp. A-T 1434]